MQIEIYSSRVNNVVNLVSYLWFLKLKLLKGFPEPQSQSEVFWLSIQALQSAL